VLFRSEKRERRHEPRPSPGASVRRRIIGLPVSPRPTGRAHRRRQEARRRLDALHPSLAREAGADSARRPPQTVHRRRESPAPLRADRHPETHYATLAQPLRIDARDRLLKLAGFGNVEFGPHGAVTPAPHQQALRTIAEQAREGNRGVWAHDESAEFRLADQDSIGPAGVLILPKLFRRCSDYLKAVAGGFMGTIDDWLVGVSSTGRRPEDDKLLVCGRTRIRLHRRSPRHRLRREVGRDSTDARPARRGCPPSGWRAR
jgi:hypothetical protein